MNENTFYYGINCITVDKDGIVSLKMTDSFNADELYGYWKDKYGIRHYTYNCEIKEIKNKMYKENDTEFLRVIIRFDDFDTSCDWIFNLYENSAEISMCIHGENLSIGEICPLYTEKFDVYHYDGYRDYRVLRVPFDNDKWDRFKSLPYEDSEMSYEVTAFYDEEKRNGIIIGSVSHDTWKSGIDLKYCRSNGKLKCLCGIADDNTRDYGVPHGNVSGDKVSSASIAIIPTDDWRYGMITYGELCEKNQPRLKWNSDLICGWNSWSAYMADIDFDKYISASECMKNFEDVKKYTDGKMYINFDAFWNKLSSDELKTAVSTVKKNGQIPGVYFAPLAGWSGLESMDEPVRSECGQIVEVKGFEGIKRKDLLLRDKSGNIRHEIAGGYPLDVTHPVLLKKIKMDIEEAKTLGFGYVKIDFLCHGIVEGEHYNKNIQTGVQAYNFIMKYISELCQNAGMFISLSIAPLFPAGYGHARRICCDVFGKIGDSEYGLNALTYGFWENGTIYEFTDPDHLCCREGDAEAKMRFVSSAISGTMMIWSDKIEDKNSCDRAQKWYQNKGVMNIAKKHKAFMPIESGIGQSAAETFMLKDENKTYIALFNFSNQEKRFIIPTEKIGMDNEEHWGFDLISGEEFVIKGAVCVLLNPYDCYLAEISNK